MWARIPILGWGMSIILNIFLAIPTYYLWNYIAPKYLYFIPDLFIYLPFWDIVWMVMLISILKHVFLGGIFKANIETNNDE